MASSSAHRPVARVSKAQIEPTRTPLRAVADLALGEQQQIILGNGDSVRVRLINIKDTVDSLRGAVRTSRVTVEVNGERGELVSATYHLPVRIGGVRVDCPITSGYQAKCNIDFWGFEKNARLRLWPGNSPLIAPGTFTYPARQRWFATDTQMANEPCFVGGAETVSKDAVYYHNGLDIGGAEGMTEVIASADGIVLCRGDDHDPLLEHFAYPQRYDRVAVVDERGWLHMFSHLHSIDDNIQVGGTVVRGQRIGLLGKEGSSGGWAHLHFGLKCRQPSGQWGTEEGYAYLWEAYLAEYQPQVIAVARPHHLLKTGETARLDASKSWCRDEAGIAAYEWQFCDGTRASGPCIERTYTRSGIYSEAVCVQDRHGNRDVDCTVVQVFDGFEAQPKPPGIHATYFPTLGIRPGNPVIFKVRSFYAPHGEEVWDFGDGNPSTVTRSVPLGPAGADKHHPQGYADIVHRYQKPGHYIARVERVGAGGLSAISQVYVHVQD